MIIVDSALRAREAEGRPIRVGMIGAGFMAQGLANQIVNSVPGMDLVAVYGRRLERALEVYRVRGRSRCGDATTPGRARAGDPRAARRSSRRTRSRSAARSRSTSIVDVTGSVEFGAQVALEAFEHGKHVIAMNAEVDATVGPILQVYARRHGVIFSACDGDEPGLQMNLTAG